MSDKTKTLDQEAGRDWRKTLFLPQTKFPMKAGLPKLEPELLQRWSDIELHKQLRAQSKGREKFILHDGPPYANGNLHIGHALNKILKDAVTRSQQMMGHDSVYVPGWDCHGLPIEWKIEEQYRSKGKDKDEVPIVDFRQECRDFADHWIDIQREEFKRLGVEGDWDNPYTTMSFTAEARIAGELMKFAMNGSLYRGSKPVMWSVVERTALAEAEVEYEDHTSPTIWVKFPVQGSVQTSEGTDVEEANVVIWTTTPWTIPGNRAIAYSKAISYGVYEVTKAPDDNWAGVGEKYILSEGLAESVREAARIDEWKRIGTVDPATLSHCHHPFHGLGYDFEVRLYAGDFVTDDAGTGFVHCAPGHGADDYNLFEDNKNSFEEAGIPEVPHTVGADGFYFEAVPLFGGDQPKRVIDDKGKFGDANEAVAGKLAETGALIARGRLKHTYPHSWRSKKPVIFRNTPQWFIAIDKPVTIENASDNVTIRELSLQAIDDTRFVPETGRNRIHSMIEHRPDWVISRQRAGGVPITVFVNKESGQVIPGRDFDKSKALIDRITTAFAEEGADAWFQPDAAQRFLEGLVNKPEDWEQVTDILDVWFDSGSTHSFVLEDREELQWPASLYLEGSDQHRGWFHSSLLESCGTRGRAPYDAVLTHGFVMAEDGRKMSKSLGNIVAPQNVIKQNGAEILRMWALSSDYSEDLRIGPEIIKTNVDGYRKIRNTIRFLLGNLAHAQATDKVTHGDMPELERYMLHRLCELDILVRQAYNDFDFKRVFQALFHFSTVELSAFYFDIRKDALYCDPLNSIVRRSSLTLLDHLFNCLTAWLAPILCFTMEEAWLARNPDDKASVHMCQFPEIPGDWKDDALAERWRQIRMVRRVVTGALEIERQEKRIGSSLEAAPVVYLTDPALKKVLETVDLAEVFITSQASLSDQSVPAEAFTLEDVAGVGVVSQMAQGRKCARSWKIGEDVGTDQEFPELSLRDAEAVRQFDKANGT